MTMGPAELRINLGSLKRQDPYIENIIDSSTHVAIYSFSPQLNEWEKTEVEGTLFVYKRVAPPYWGFTIMNRLSMENLTEPLNSELEFQTQNPFLLYRNAKLLIYGIWFYDQEDCRRIGGVLERLSKDSNKTNSVASKLQSLNLFMDKDVVEPPKQSSAKSLSPTSNSGNSISPGSSFGGGIARQASNGDVDSECEDKDARTTDKGSIDILDLLSKAQDKFEKEKRNTPDPVTENLKNIIPPNPTDADTQLFRPVPVKPAHPRKLDVATLFKQHPQETSAVNQAVNQNLVIQTSTNPYQDVSGRAIPTVPAVAPQAKRNIRQIGRSFSMNELAMRQMDAYANGHVLSVEEIEAGLNKSATTAADNARQQQVNSTLDKMIDRINSGSLPLQRPGLSGIKEAKSSSFTGVNSSTSGNSGSLVTNGNKVVYSESDVFANVNNHPYAGTSVHLPPQTITKSNIPRQRSMSSSVLQPSNSIPIPVPANARFNGTFPGVPNLPISATVPVHATPTPTRLSSANALLHGKVVSGKTAQTGSAIAATLSSISIGNQESKVSSTAASTQAKKTSPSIGTTLISPEDFERSAGTPQKKLELRQRLMQEAPTSQVNRTKVTVQYPLNKEQLCKVLITLLQKDDSFITTIHDAYLENFKQS